MLDRACIHVNITEHLLEYVELTHASGIACGYNIWYEDFNTGCSFRSFEDHAIDAFPLLHARKEKISISLLKNPKQKSVAEILSLVTRQDKLATRAVEANVV